MKGYKTNSVHVKGLVKDHMIDSLKGQTDGNQTVEELLVANVNANLWGDRSVFDAINSYIDRGCFICYHWEVKEFLNGLGINPEGKEYDSSVSWDLYKTLLTREIQKVYRSHEHDSI